MCTRFSNLPVDNKVPKNKFFYNLFEKMFFFSLVKTEFLTNIEFNYPNFNWAV